MDEIVINGVKYTRETFGEIENVDVREFLEEWFSDSATVNLHTSGSTGVPKLIVAEKSRMEASARMTIEYLNLSKGDTALLCMPVKYIAGKMMIVRAIIGGLDLLLGDVSGNPLDNEDRHIDFAAMVPLQVYNSVKNQRAKFEKLGKVIIGGGAIDKGLEESMSVLCNEIYATYGMTETLSHIAMRRVNGENKSEYFSPMRCVEIGLSEDDCLSIYAPNLCAERLQTNDIAEMKTDHTFRILGRKDNVVCSGGIKLQIEQIEAKLGGVITQNYAFSSQKDERLGERLVLVVESAERVEIEPEILAKYLSKYEMPKSVICVPEIPRTKSGKIARARLKMLIG